MTREEIFALIDAERLRQIHQHNYSFANDVANTQLEWVRLITRQVGLILAEGGKVSQDRLERQMVRVASLAVACLESLPEKQPSSKVAGAYTKGSGV